MQIKKSVIQTALKQCLSGIENGTSIIDGADTFIFENGNVHVYNDAISVSVMNKFPEELNGAVKAKDFIALLNRLKDEDISIEIEKDDEKPVSWKMKCGRSKPTVTLLESEQAFMMLQSIHDHSETFKQLPGNFLEGVGLCLMPNKSAFSGIVTTEKEIFTTDGVSINNFTMDSEMDSFWITNQAAIELSKLDKLETYAVNGIWVIFETEDNVRFSCKTQDVSGYPIAGLKKYIEKFMDKTDVIQNRLPKEIGEVAERAAVLGKDVSGVMAVKLTFKKDEIEVFSERSTGTLTESIPLGSPFEEDPGIEAWVGAPFLKAAAGKVEDFHITKVDGGITLVFYNENYVQATKTIVL